MPPKPTQEARKCPECDGKNVKSIEKHYHDKMSAQSGSSPMCDVNPANNLPDMPNSGKLA